MDAYDKAIKQNYKVDPDALTPKIKEDIYKVLKGEPAPPTMPVDVVNAVKDMRGHLDDQSLEILSKKMISDRLVNDTYKPGAKGEAAREKAETKAMTKSEQLVKNLGSYTTRSYRMFDDPSFGAREISTQHRPEAEADLNRILSDKTKSQLVREAAKNAGDEAARVHPPGSVERDAAYKRAYDAALIKGKANPGSLYIAKNMANWEQIARNRQTKGLQYGHAYAVDDKLLKNLSPILNQSEAFRNLMGEERDVKAVYARSAWRQSAFIHSIEMSREAARLGKQNGWLSDRQSPTNSAQIPSQFSHLGKMAGKWTTPEIAGALTDHAETMRQAENGVIGGVLKFMEGKARYMTTIGSLQRGLGNVWSGVFSHLNNGYFNPFDPSAASGAWNVVKAQVGRMSNPEVNAYIDKMHRLGLSDKTGNVGLVMDYLRHGPHILERDPLDSYEQFTDWLKKAGHNKIANGIGEFAIDLHTMGNFLSKASQWEKEKVRQQEINEWNVNNAGATRLTPEQIDELAADRVRSQNVSYSLATKSIQQMRKNPMLGTFVTFWGESLRAYGTSAMYALKDLQSNNPIQKRIGMARLGGMITSLAIPGALMAASKAAYGVSDKEDDNFRSLLPPWEQHNAFLYGPLVNGRRTYTTLNYLTPQGDIGRSINALISPNQDGLMGKVMASGYELFAPVLNFPLIGNAAIDVARNQTGYGTPVYNPQDTFWNKTGDIVQHIMHAEIGGTAGRIGSKIIPALTTPGGKVTPGGAVYDWNSSITPELTGQSIKEISYPDRFRSVLYSTKDMIDHAQQIFTGPIQRSNNELTDHQISSLYQQSENARRNAFNTLSRQIDAARFGGMTSRDIKVALQSRRYSTQEINDLMTGRYRPYIPSAAVLKNARANGNFIPPGLIGHGTTFYDTTEEE